MGARGTFIMVDGIGGSGKSTVIAALAARLEAAGKRLFHQAVWEKREGRTPAFSEVTEATVDPLDADVLFTAEPTQAWVGAAIRQELSRTDDPYDGTVAAHAFALDRAVLYKRLLLPALAAGKHIVQDRGVCTSLAYQPLMHDSMGIDEVAALPGNRMALEHRPDVLILVRVRPETAAKRLAGRPGPTKGVYGDIPFLTRVAAVYESTAFQERFRRLGTRVEVLDAEEEPSVVAEKAWRLIQHDLLPPT